MGRGRARTPPRPDTVDLFNGRQSVIRVQRNGQATSTNDLHSTGQCRLRRIVPVAAVWLNHTGARCLDGEQTASLARTGGTAVPRDFYLGALAVTPPSWISNSEDEPRARNCEDGRFGRTAVLELVVSWREVAHSRPQLGRSFEAIVVSKYTTSSWYQLQMYGVAYVPIPYVQAISPWIFQRPRPIILSQPCLVEQGLRIRAAPPAPSGKASDA